MIVEHRFKPDAFSMNCICGESKESHKYQSSMVIVKLENNPSGYEYCGDVLPFYTGEVRGK